MTGTCSGRSAGLKKTCLSQVGEWRERGLIRGPRMDWSRARENGLGKEDGEAA